MKKKIVIFTMLAALVTCSLIFIGFNSKTIFSGYKEEAFEGYEIEEIKGYEKIEREKVDKEKSKGLNGKKINGKYAYSQNLSYNDISNVFDEYSIYDIYEDEDYEYVYLDNSDVCCGFRRNNFSSDPDVTIEEEEATKIANEYFEQVNGKDSGYDFVSCEYIDWGNYYEFIWVRHIGKVKTDDKVIIWVDGSGEITAYSAFKMNRYEDVKLSEEEVTSKELSDVGEYIEYDNYTIANQYISYDEDGELVMVNEVEVLKPVGEAFIAEVLTVNIPIKR